MGIKMRKLTMALLASAIAWPALGADVAVKKALRPNVLLTYQGCGTYVGLGTFGEVDRASITGTAGPAMSADIAGAALSISLGYMCGNGPSWWALDAAVDWFNVGGSNVQGNIIPASVNAQWGFTQRVLYGGPLASVLNILPNLSTVFPALPVPTVPVVGTVHPYVFAAVHEKDVSASYMAMSGKVWRVQAGLGVGAKQQLGAVQGNPAASQVTVDYYAEYLIPGSGITIGNVGPVSASANTGAGARIGMSLEY